jgi:hypothetical protein
VIKNVSQDKTLEPPWEPSRWIITDGVTKRADERMWQFGQRIKRGEVELYDQPAIAPNAIVEWTFVAYPLQENEWMDHVEWELFGQSYSSSVFDPGEFRNNHNFQPCPQSP